MGNCPRAFYKITSKPTFIMILIICEKYRTAKTVALAMNADNNANTPSGIFASDTVTVATVPTGFIRHTPLDEMTDGEYPFIPARFKMSVTMKELERELKPLFRDAEEVVFASDGGADAQARFFNICRHFRVGCPRSRMWLTRLSYGAIRGAFKFRESGRHLHRLAQTGLVSKGMDMLFAYNTNQAFLHIGLPAYDLTRQEAIAMEQIGDITSRYDDFCSVPAGHNILINVNGAESYESDTVWEDKAEAEAAFAGINVGDTVPATLTVEETDRYNIRFHTLLTLQMDAFNNLGLSPGMTTKVAQCLYEKGLISSPMTSCSHLPEKLRGHLQTVFTETPGYHWGDNGATLDNHAIITLRAADDDMTRDEKKLYWLIFNRMKAVVEQNPTRKYATMEFKAGDTAFYRQWEITDEAYHVTETGTFEAMITIGDAGVYPCDEERKVSGNVADAVCALTTKAAFVDDMMHTNVPFTKSSDDYGTVIGSLIDKGLVCIETDNEIYLTPEGQYVYDELTGHGFSDALLAWQFEANDLYEGDRTGRDVMDEFCGSLLNMVEAIDPECGE